MIRLRELQTEMARQSDRVKPVPSREVASLIDKIERPVQSPDEGLVREYHARIQRLAEQRTREADKLG